MPTRAELQLHRAQPHRGRSRQYLAPGEVYLGYTKRPTVLINLGLLVNTVLWKPEQCGAQVCAMPGVQNLCSLMPYFRVGVFCDWDEVPARAATVCLNRMMQEVVHGQHANADAVRTTELCF